MLDPLTDREKEVLSTLVDVWDQNDSPLPGRLSYGDVFRLLDRLGVPRPVRLSAFIEKVDGHNLPNQGEPS